MLKVCDGEFEGSAAGCGTAGASSALLGLRVEGVYRRLPRRRHHRCRH